jgi:hypothetical protein
LGGDTLDASTVTFEEMGDRQDAQIDYAGSKRIVTSRRLGKSTAKMPRR